MTVAVYVLTRRRPLYAADHVLATGLVVVATTTARIATTVILAVRGGVVPGLTAGAVATALLATGAVLHGRRRVQQPATNAR